ncbi:hypothetical protein HPB48_014962 [Haemaphysalis longicornis]|uniref:Uncharacterized protein n=1 Tax=Haemaphysalis longicornis TaxID=44386 RepID=A0A9J6FGV1_HAELO|nr:hypothetical protein HPB48_014962 [Haemaphysalis longicornis]
MNGPLVLCQLNAASFTRSEPWAYRAEHIPTEHCTHVVFSMAGLKDWFNDLINYDVYHLATRPFFWKAVDLLLEKKKAHLLVSVGTFGDASRLITDVAGNSDTMARFSRNLVRWVLGNKLDGALMAGVFPAPGPLRNAMVKMVKKIGTLFRVHHLHLGLVVPPHAKLFHNRGAGVKLAQFVDVVVVMVSPFPFTGLCGKPTCMLCTRVIGHPKITGNSGHHVRSCQPFWQPSHPSHGALFN